MNWHRTYEELDAISRTRALTMPESRKLEKAICAIDQKAPLRWTAEEERRLIALVSAGHTIGQAGRMLGKSRSAAVGKWSRIQGRRA